MKKTAAKLYIYQEISYLTNLRNLEKSLQKLSDRLSGDPLNDKVKSIIKNIQELKQVEALTNQGSWINSLDEKLKELNIEIKLLRKQEITPELAAIIKELCGGLFGGGLIQKVLRDIGNYKKMIINEYIAKRK